jgi:hypothetical protein
MTTTPQIRRPSQGPRVIVPCLRSVPFDGTVRDLWAAWQAGHPDPDPPESSAGDGSVLAPLGAPVGVDDPAKPLSRRVA